MSVRKASVARSEAPLETLLPVNGLLSKDVKVVGDGPVLMGDELALPVDVLRE